MRRLLAALVGPSLLPGHLAGKVVSGPWPWSCWLFDARWESGNGYKKARWKGRAFMAHRLVYLLLVGPIGVRSHLDHRCRRRWCCNPLHLEEVSPRENTRRGDAVLFERKRT